LALHLGGGVSKRFGNAFGRLLSRRDEEPNEAAAKKFGNKRLNHNYSLLRGKKRVFPSSTLATSGLLLRILVLVKVLEPCVIGV
jgi:hypothetical protein